MEILYQRSLYCFFISINPSAGRHLSIRRKLEEERRSGGGGAHLSRNRDSDTQDDSSLLKSIFNKMSKRDGLAIWSQRSYPF